MVGVRGLGVYVLRILCVCACVRVSPVPHTLNTPSKHAAITRKTQASQTAGRHALVGEHAGHDGADGAAEAVGGEDVELVVHVVRVLDELAAHVAEEGRHLLVVVVVDGLWLMGW